MTDTSDPTDRNEPIKTRPAPAIRRGTRALNSLRAAARSAPPLRPDRQGGRPDRRRGRHRRRVRRRRASGGRRQRSELRARGRRRSSRRNQPAPHRRPRRSLANGGTQGSLSGAGVPATTKDQTGTSSENQVVAAADATQIVKTGQMTLEVTDINGAVKQAQTTITGLGGYVDSSNLSGIGESATATITYRFPVARWDDALSALAKIGTKVLSEQTGATDVTSQVIDLNARIDNLKTTETALQGIMARASAIPDVIAVENQLSDTQGQIEELTAERDHLNNQAAMSTLTATFQLPTQTVTTQATQDWTLGNQVDEAGAALVRIGQGLATMVVWVAVVVLPLGLAALLLFVIARLTRRILGRAGRRDAAAGA